MRIQHFYTWIRIWIGSAEKIPDPTLNRNEEKNIFIFKVFLFDLINHHFKLEFVDSGLYFFQAENNFINSLLQVGSGSGYNEKSNGSGGPKINIKSYSH